MVDFMAVTWLGNTCDAQGRRDDAVEYYRKALEMADNHGLIRHDQFGLQISSEWIQQRLLAPFNWRSVVKK
jgi:tetratricopeptide (TPR) repeat protein